MKLPRGGLRTPVLLLLTLELASAQGQLTRGQLLVADPKLPDPDFAQTVILLVHYDSQGAVGFMINRRTKIPLSELFPEVKAARHKSDPLYAGGPVPYGTNALLRSRTRPEDSEPVLPGVYIIADKSRQQQSIAAGWDATRFRVYVGYCGWSGAQLRQEIMSGLWHVIPASAALVFDPDVDSLWSRLRTAAR